MNKVKLLVVFIVLNFNLSVHAEQEIIIDVYRSPSCSCCSRWMTHLENNQFKIKDHLMDDMQIIKNKYGVPNNMASCHTALVNGYVIEGHVPATDIKKLLQLKPKVIGISVPAMPVGTPGMEMGNKKDAYNVISFDKENNYQIFNSYQGN